MHNALKTYNLTSDIISFFSLRTKGKQGGGGGGVCGRQVDGSASVVFRRAHLQCYYVCLLLFSYLYIHITVCSFYEFRGTIFMYTTCRYYLVRAYDIVICIHYLMPHLNTHARTHTHTYRFPTVAILCISLLYLCLLCSPFRPLAHRSS